MSKWVSVNDRLPDKGEVVISKDSSGRSFVTIFKFVTPPTFWHLKSNIEHRNVLYWRDTSECTEIF